MVRVAGELQGSSPVYGSNEKQTIGRRGLIAGVIGAAGLGVFVGRGMNGGEDQPDSNSGVVLDVEADRGTDESAEVSQDVAIPGKVESIVLDDVARNPAIFDGGRTPEELAEQIEQSPRLFEKSFNITEEEVASPEDYPDVFAERLQDALNTGCTLEEAEPYIKSITDRDTRLVAVAGFVAEMLDKYDLLVFQGMFITNERLTLQEAQQNGTFNIFSRAHGVVLERFMNRILDHGDMNEAIKVKTLDYELGKVFTDNSYTMGIDMQFTNNYGDEDGFGDGEYSIEGSVRVRVTPENGVLGALINSDPSYHAPFIELDRL